MELLTRAIAGSLPQVRLVGEGVNEIVSTQDAFRRAYDAGLDLVLVSDKSTPPVVRIEDFKKLLYLKKKEKQAQHAKGSVLKEIQVKLNISDHDLETKLTTARRFLDRGDKVKINVRLKGREREMRDRIRALLDRVAAGAGGKPSNIGFGVLLIEPTAAKVDVAKE